jgi:hypothetical protein
MTAAEALQHATKPLLAREIARLAKMPVEAVYQELVSLEARGQARFLVSYRTRNAATVALWEKM